MSDLLAKLRANRHQVTLSECADILGINPEDIYTPSEVFSVYLYFGCVYILELTNGTYWTVVSNIDRYQATTLDAIERQSFEAFHNLIDFDSF